MTPLDATDPTMAVGIVANLRALSNADLEAIERKNVWDPMNRLIVVGASVVLAERGVAS